jgi:ubiquinone biosynthesis protein UbiJ
VHQGRSADPALTIRVPLTDFVRVLTTAGSFYPLILDGRMTMEGDLALANRLAEMFGARSNY